MYTCPFLIVITKTPFYASFYNIFVNYNRSMYFEYVNEDSNLSYIAEYFKVYRNYITNNNELHMQVTLVQNINEEELDMVTTDNLGNIIDSRLHCYLVLYVKNNDGETYPYRYIKGYVTSWREDQLIYTVDFAITTSNIIANNEVKMLFDSGLFSIGSDEEIPTYLEQNMECKLFVLIRDKEEYGRHYGLNKELSADSLFPDLGGYTLTNIYSFGTNGLDFFYDYTDLMTSYVNITKAESIINFELYRLPVIRYLWCNSEDRMQSFFMQVDYKRRFIEQAIDDLEDSFGINFKLYNTYGPSRNYNVNNTVNIDRVDISLRFEIKFVSKEDQVLIQEIKQKIQDYIENNEEEDLHIPNLCNYIKNLYNDSIVYIKFIKLNDYNTLYQSIYKNPEVAEDYFSETQNVPEFINLHTLENGETDIVFDIIS